MKRLLTLVLASFAFAACTQNEVEELTANREALPETLTVGFEGGDTRVELNEALKTVWSKGDEVSVFYLSDANQKWQYQGETGERLGTLKCVDRGVAEEKMQRVVVAYPYNAKYVVNTDTHNLYASLPAVQSYKEDSYGAEGNIMVAQSEFTQFSLKSVCGWLRVELTGEGESVKSITLRGNAGEQVAGLIYVDTATAEATLATEIGEASDEEQVGGVGGGLEFDAAVFTEVTLNCGDGVTLGAEATAFYIALLPQTFEKGMTIEINYANSNSQPLVCENSITISRNHISPIGIEANEEVEIPANQLWYTATAKVEPYDATAFNVAIVSNELDEATGEGIITFDGELTTIGDRVFDGCESLTSVTIPDSVTTIGYMAFYDCNSLTSVTIPDSVTTIGEGAFCSCDSLTSVTIPDSVTTIGEGVFADCSNLAEFKGKFAADGGRCLIKDNAIIAYAEASGIEYTIPDSVTSIGDGVFEGCYSLASVTIPDSVTTIGDDAFWDCCSLTSVTIPDSVTTIGNYAFSYCGSLTSVYCKATAPPTLGYYVFDDNAFGRKIYVTAESVGAYKAAENWSEYADYIVGYNFGAGEEEEVPTNQLWYTATALVEPYDTSAFNVAIVSNEWDEATGEGVITFAGELTTIGEGAFWNCNSLTSVTIPDSVTTIGYEAFRNCDSLTSVTIPDSVTTIGKYAFGGCSSLTSVTIGDSVTTIGNFAFYACHSLAEFNGKFAADGGRCLIKDNAIIAYAEASGTTYTIPDYVTTIGDGAFSNCNSLTSVTIPDSVTTIGDEAFYYCSSLTSVTIPDSVTTIGRSAFYDCDSLTSVTIPDSVTTIGNHAFYACDSLTSVTIGDSVTMIGVMAFWGCKSLTSVYCKAAAPPHIDGDVFDENSTDRKIYVYEEYVDAYKTAWSEFADSIVAGGNIPESVTTTILYTTSDEAVIDASKFPVKSHTYNNGVGELILYGELKAIPDRAFYEFGTLTTITIPDSVTTIGDYAFDGCTSLTSVTIGDSVTAIGDRAFYYCDSLTSVTIPDSVTTIGEEVFYACDGLTKVTIGDSVTTIGRGTFSDCNSLTSVTIGDSVTTIGDSAFRDCHSLTSVTIPDSVTTIGYEAFRNCDDLTSVTIGDSVTTIGGSAFYYCSSLTSVTIPDSVTTIGNFAFYACHSLAEFKGKFAADDGRCLIKDNTIIAYANASGTTYTIPNSVTTIGDGAFSNCNSLTSVTILDSMTAIGEGVFFYCDSLTSVYCKAITPPILGNDVFKTWSLSNGYVNLGCAIYVPAESVEAYKAAENWSEYAADIVGYDFE